MSAAEVSNAVAVGQPRRCPVEDPERQSRWFSSVARRQHVRYARKYGTLTQLLEYMLINARSERARALYLAQVLRINGEDHFAYWELRSEYSIRRGAARDWYQCAWKLILAADLKRSLLKKGGDR